jgi:hypothetical protein
MIRLPRRSVTRFFIPLIDVLTLLFCIFLVLPLVKNPEDETDRAARDDRMHQLELEVERLRRAGTEEAMRAELERMRQEWTKSLKERLAVRVLEIDGAMGNLYYRDPERVEIRNEAEARALIDRDQREQGASRRELYYLILYPRDRGSSFPTRGQREQYERWFEGVALGFDVPGAGPERGKQP